MAADSLVSARIVTAFKECLKGYEVLRTIDDLFGDLAVPLDPDAEEQERSRFGDRRGRAAGYIASLDLRDPRDAAVLVSAIGTMLDEWQSNSGDLLARLMKALDAGGFAWDGRRLTRSEGALGEIADAVVVGSLSIVEVEEQFRRISGNLDRDPAAAITASRALVEAVCKAVLDRTGNVINDRDDLPSLYKKAAAALNVDPTQHDQAIYKQTLQGLVSAVQGLAELRNVLGSAHGKGARAVRPKSRHARLAAGAAWTISTFLAETLTEHASRAGGATGEDTPTVR